MKSFLKSVIGHLIIIGIFFSAVAFANKLQDSGANQIKDANSNLVEIATGFITQDATGTPKTSPLTVSSTEVVITVPSDAVEMVIVNTSQALRISEITGMARYVVLPSGGGHLLQVADTSTVYLKRDGGTDAIVQFYFRTI